MWLIGVELMFTSDDPTGDDSSTLRSTVIDAYDDLRKLDGVYHAEMGGSLTAGEIEFQMVVHDDDRLEAIRNASSAVRSALHSAGAQTPGWEERLEKLLHRARMTSQLVAV